MQPWAVVLLSVGLSLFAALLVLAGGAYLLLKYVGCRRYQKIKSERTRQPLNIFLIRHGESTANENDAVYRSIPDHQVPLTTPGYNMAMEAGAFLAKYFEEKYGTPECMGHCRMYVSPFLRTRSTAEGLLMAMGQWVTSVRESVYLVEQDWGLFEGPGIKEAEAKYPNEWARCQAMANHQGKFWARFPAGESCFDVCCRVSHLFHTLLDGQDQEDPVDNVIIVSHGITIRGFVLMWMNNSPEWFNHSINPPNCSIWHLEGHQDRGVLFGGFNRKGEPVPVSQLVCPEDTQREHWKAYDNLSMKQYRPHASIWIHSPIPRPSTSSGCPTEESVRHIIVSPKRNG